MSGRIRAIKPAAFLDEELWDLGERTGLPVFQAFTGLWTQADREGRFEWRPRMLRAAVLPYWSGDFESVLDALASANFIVRYEHNGRAYGLVRSFKKHQVINQREAQSSLPEPPAEFACDALPSPEDEEHMHAPADTGEHGNARVEGKGREMEQEGKGATGVAPCASAHDPVPAPSAPPEPSRAPKRQQKPKPVTWRRVPDDWAPNDDHQQIAFELGVNLSFEAQKFRDWEFNPPRSDADAAFRNWLRKASERLPRAPQQPRVFESSKDRNNRLLNERARAMNGGAASPGASALTLPLGGAAGATFGRPVAMPLPAPKALPGGRS